MEMLRFHKCDSFYTKNMQSNKHILDIILTSITGSITDEEPVLEITGPNQKTDGGAPTPQKSKFM